MRYSLLAAILLFLGGCSTPPPVPYHPLYIIPAGSLIEYYAQLDNGCWKLTLTMKSIPRAMHIREAQKWALSAAQQRLGGAWRDYRVVVHSPREPVLVWQRHGWQNP